MTQLAHIPTPVCYPERVARELYGLYDVCGVTRAVCCVHRRASMQPPRQRMSYVHMHAWGLPEVAVTRRNRAAAQPPMCGCQQ